MSRITLNLIIGSIFFLALTQGLTRQAAIVGSVRLPDLLLACGLLFCAQQVLISWLATPRVEPLDEEEEEPRRQDRRQKK